MAFVKIDVHRLRLDRQKEVFQEKCPREYKHVLEFLRLLSIGDINKGKRISERRQVKYLYALSIFVSYFKKAITALCKEDMRQFVEDLERNTIKTRVGEPYADSTKHDIKMALRVYLKWRIPAKYALLTDWIDYRLAKRTPEALTEQEIETLFEHCRTAWQRYAVAVLFDSGLRASEFHNVRFEDVHEPTESFPYYRIEAKTEYSKTEGRTVGLYWKESTKAIRDYLAECTDKSPGNPVFVHSYDSLRMFIGRLGKTVLRRRVYMHLFRKSSATYYASRMNRQQLCVRYGWRFSSDMPDVYIRRAGVEEEMVKDVMVNTNMTKLDKSNQELQTKVGLLNDQFDRQNKTLASFEELLDLIASSPAGQKMLKKSLPKTGLIPETVR